MHYTILSEKEYKELFTKKEQKKVKKENSWYTNSSHILEFIIFGNIIAEVEVPDNNTDFYHYGINAWTSNHMIIKNPKNIWDKEILTKLKEEGADLFADDEILLKLAEIGHYEEILQFLKEEK